ncbi:glycoside hydrolase family 15 protein [Microvirga thermotolerans]|uniref:glucan 1,4-alpha-glucosidase n=1 Tax=Microvirga thermotolerans TaxID=2651334 RepID=A0A5P9JY51_9HYPH|nr:glycoside hydrolase family 15 protein [Microvirga thermotolerans]QFU17537.1 glucan 1,4-alpha-glucosidase [Microvirga thermotolerans]
MPADAGGMDDGLTAWMKAEMAFASAAILRCVSATDRVMRRTPFGQTVVPKPGSVVAAPNTDPASGEPDYFFHWIRDSAIVMDALRVLHCRGMCPDARRILDAFVSFSLGLSGLDGASLVRQGLSRHTILPDVLKYVRPNEELENVRGDAVLGEARFNPDGTLDIIRWSRPQHDGPALRALVLLRWHRVADGLGAGVEALVEQDLAFVERHWREPCYDIWEEESGYHYYTRLVQMEALSAGAEWLDEGGNRRQAVRCRSAAQALRTQLDRHWSPDRGFYLSRLGTPRTDPDKSLDSSVFLAVLHAARDGREHGLRDPRMQATLRELERLFASEYAINRSPREGRALAMGRYAGDRYVSGGAWYMTTLGAAEFHYSLAERMVSDDALKGSDRGTLLAVDASRTAKGDDLSPRLTGGSAGPAGALIARGDGFMRVVRDHTPGSGELSEQFDQSSGQQTSARNLAWSYAGFITAYDARERAMAALHEAVQS